MHFKETKLDPRIQIHQRGIIFEYWRDHRHFLHPMFNNELWFIEEERVFRVGLERKLWDYTDILYDGHTVKGFTLLGLSISWSDTYRSQPCRYIEAALAHLPDIT